MKLFNERDRLGRQDFSLLIELGDLLCQQGHIRPPRSVSIRNPSCSQITEAVNEKFHVFRARPFTKQVRNRERPSKQGITAEISRAPCVTTGKGISRTIAASSSGGKSVMGTAKIAVIFPVIEVAAARS